MPIKMSLKSDTLELGESFGINDEDPGRTEDGIDTRYSFVFMSVSVAVQISPSHWAFSETEQ